MVAPSSSDPFQLEPISGQLSLPLADLAMTDEQLEPEGFFDEAMAAIWEASYQQTTRTLETERLNPADSLLRMQVPVLDNKISNPEWQGHLSTPKIQLRWLQQDLSFAFQLPSSDLSTQLSSCLRWAPVPHGKGQSPIFETLGQLGPSSLGFLILDMPQISSENHVIRFPIPMVLRAFEDEEIEVQHAPPKELASPAMRGFLPDYMETRRPDACHGPSVSKDQPLLELPLLKNPLRRKCSETTNALPINSSSGDTSRLLSNFLELRHCKKAKYSQPSRLVNKTAQHSFAEGPSHLTQSETSAQPVNQTEAPYPKYSIPDISCCFIISASLHRTVLSHIEKGWPGVELVDRDFSEHNAVTWSPGSAQRRGAVSSLSFEADIVLCPSAGIIITTMLKVRQKPLPGSNAMTPLREQIERVGAKYETLFILISQTNPRGEYVGPTASSDISAYADLVRFATSLQSGIVTYIIPGAVTTLSHWILSFMCRFSSQAAQFGTVLASRDTSWVLFLRRAGFNIAAAQVLSNILLAEFGNVGMAQFLAMESQDRIAKFGQLLGEKVLRNVGMLLDKSWT